MGRGIVLNVRDSKASAAAPGRLDSSSHRTSKRGVGEASGSRAPPKPPSHRAIPEAEAAEIAELTALFAKQADPQPKAATAEKVNLQPPKLSAEAFAEATERYSKTPALRSLLTHDPALGGAPIKLLSARWLLTFFQAHPEARLEHREHLERTAPEAFVSGDTLERVLTELRGGEEHGLEDELTGDPIKGGVYMTEVGGEYKPVKDADKYGGYPVEISFPSAVAMSHMCAPPPRPPSNAAARGPAATH